MLVQILLPTMLSFCIHISLGLRLHATTPKESILTAVSELQRPAIREMAGHRLIIQEMMSQGNPTKKTHILQEKDMSKMGRYTTYLMNLLTGPKGCLLNIA